MGELFLQEKLRCCCYEERGNGCQAVRATGGQHEDFMRPRRKLGEMAGALQTQLQQDDADTTSPAPDSQCSSRKSRLRPRFHRRHPDGHHLTQPAFVDEETEGGGGDGVPAVTPWGSPCPNSTQFGRLPTLPCHPSSPREENVINPTPVFQTRKPRHRVIKYLALGRTARERWGGIFASGQGFP